MINLKNISITKKLVLIQVLTSVLVLAIFFTGFIITDIKDYKERKVKSVQGIAKVIAANNISTLQFQDVEEAKKVLSELQNIAPDIISAVIVDKKGQLFASYVKKTHDTIGNYKLHDESFEFVDNNLYITNVITTDSNEALGKVYINCELTELAEMKKSKLSIAGMSLIFSLIAGFLIAYIIQTYVSKRLLFLVSKMEETGKTGNYNVNIEDDGKDEIGRLFKVYNDLMQQVNESQRKKDEFIGIASHELKTPLTSIKGYIELLSDMEEREPQKQFVQRTAQNVRKLEMLIKDLLDVSKINSGQLTLNLSEFNIKDLIEDTISSMQAAQTKHQIIKQLDFDDVIIKGDSQRIEQVLVNLLSNAVKYSPDASKVFVSCKTNNGDIIIKVKDLGTGIPEGEHTKIFDRFYRSQSAPTHISGFGLGLYICNDIIKRHNGKIWVESSGQGSSFYFSLPIKEKFVGDQSL